jgi:hypothetical protein
MCPASHIDHTVKDSVRGRKRVDWELTGRHSEQTTAPGVPMKRPRWQAVQRLKPCTLAKVPGKHCRHTDCCEREFHVIE